MKFCAVEDPQGERIVFHMGEDILVLNNDWRPDGRYDMCDAWVGKIVDIRGNSPRNTWAIVQWYFSGNDIAEHEPVEGCRAAVDTSYYGKFERSLSQDRQVISALSINGKATVVDFDETSSTQEPIAAECFYTRRLYNSLFGSVMPVAEKSITCICRRPYNPDESDPMHFCPRDGCKKWYHRNCLHENDYKFENSLDSEAPTRDSNSEFLDVPQDRVSSVPSDLVRLACTPIIRGGPTHGVVGNVKTVCEARKWAQLYAGTPLSEIRPGLLLDGITLDRWIDGLDGIEVEELIYPDDESGSVSFYAPMRAQDEQQAPAPYKCPCCGRAI